MNGEMKHTPRGTAPDTRSLNEVKEKSKAEDGNNVKAENSEERKQ